MKVGKAGCKVWLMQMQTSAFNNHQLFYFWVVFSNRMGVMAHIGGARRPFCTSAKFCISHHSTARNITKLWCVMRGKDIKWTIRPCLQIAEENNNQPDVFHWTLGWAFCLTLPYRAIFCQKFMGPKNYEAIFGTYRESQVKYRESQKAVEYPIYT